MNLLLAAENAGSTSTSTGSNTSSVWVWVIFAVMIVAMILLTIVPNKKRQKEYQKMQDEMRVGTKIMTIGRMIGIITKINSDNSVEVDVGTPGNPVVITINREAIAINLSAQEAAKAEKEAFEAKKQAIKEQNSVEVADVENSEEAVVSEEGELEEVVEVKESNPQIKDEDDAI